MAGRRQVLSPSGTADPANRDPLTGLPDERLLRVTVDAARTLGAKTIATGVERPRDRSLARRSGCDLAEGYLLGWPVPADRFPAEEG